jgi:hypothetical protein
VMLLNFLNFMYFFLKERKIKILWLYFNYLFFVLIFGVCLVVT